MDESSIRERTMSGEEPPIGGHDDHVAPAPADVVAGVNPVLRVEISGRTIWQAIGAVLLTLVLIRAAIAMRPVLFLVAMAFFFSLALDPAVSALATSRGWRRGAAVGVVYLTGFAVVVFLVALLIPAIGTLADVVSTRAEDWIASLNAWTMDNLGFAATSPAAAADVSVAGDLVRDFGAGAFGAALGIAGAGAGFMFNAATVAMFTFYFTADAPRIRHAVLRLFAPRMQERIGWTWDQAIKQTGGYFYSRLILMAFNGGGFFVTMALVGVPVELAIPLGTFAGFVSVFIPAIGTYIGAALPVVLTLALAGALPALIVAAYALLYQQVENYFLSPRITANTMSLNGGIAFGAAMAGGALAGPIGAFVSLPVAALISATVSNYARSHEVVYGTPQVAPEVRQGRLAGT